jgi:hypothetical protein
MKNVIVLMLLFVLIVGAIGCYGNDEQFNVASCDCGSESNLSELQQTDSIIVNGECSEWDNTVVLAVLINEPAYIRRGCLTESNLFYIELVNKPYRVYKNLIYPCNGIPEKFQIDSLYVWVSGDIFRSAKGNPCFPSKPNIRIIPSNIFELKTIKTAAK